MAQTPSITFEGKTYALSDLSEVARQQVNNVRLVDQELARLRNQQMIAETAKAVYLNALKRELAQPAAVVQQAPASTN